MFSTLRGISLALFVALALIVLVAASVQAESWDSTVTTGLTSMESVFQGGAYTWTLKNNTLLPGDSDPTYDVLVWSLMPFQVKAPQSVSTPEGWEWNGGGWAVADNSNKYRTPYSVGPGQSLVFQYTPLANGDLINSNGPQPNGLGFVVHVAAVVPGSGSADGQVKWRGATTQYGGTWYDRASMTTTNLSPVPEPHGLLVLAFGVIGMGLTGARRAGSRRG